MKKLLLILLCLPMIGFGQTQKKEIENDLTRENIKGKVKQIIEAYFDAKEAFGKPKKENLTDKYKIKYNMDGNITEEIDLIFKGIDSKYKYLYNEDGNLISETEYEDDTLMMKTIYKYDEYGNIMEEISYNSDGNLTSKHKYQFDEYGNITEEMIYDYDGTLDILIKYYYDEGNISYQTSTTFNFYVPDTDTVINGVKEKRWKIQPKEHKLKYQYDENGNKTESANYNADGEIEWKNKYQYEYDKLNNWIVKTTYVDDKLENIVERKIEYYD